MLETEIKIDIAYSIPDTLEALHKRHGRSHQGAEHIRDVIYGHENKSKVRLRSSYSHIHGMRYIVELKEHQTSTNGMKNELETVLYDGASKEEALQAITSYDDNFKAESAYDKIRYTYQTKTVIITVDIYPYGAWLEIEGDKAEIIREVAELGFDLKNAIADKADDLYQKWCTDNNLSEQYDVKFGIPQTVKRQRDQTGKYINKRIWGG